MTCSVSKDDMTVRNMLDHLRIAHRHRLPKDSSMTLLHSVWERYHEVCPACGKAYSERFSSEEYRTIVETIADQVGEPG